MVISDIYNKTLLYIFGFFAVTARVIILLGLFFSQHDFLVGLGIILGIIALLSGLTFLIIVVFKGIKKNWKRLLIFAGILLIACCFPFEYSFGWTLHQADRAHRNELITGLKTGAYDSLILKNEHSQYGTWINTTPRIKIFKDPSLQMIFISHGDISSYDYYGTLFISDTSKMNDKRVGDFIYSEYNKKYLGGNWYLIECYTDTKPAP